MEWQINRRSRNAYMTSDSYWNYHYASIQTEKLVSLQSPNSEQYVEPADLSAYDFIELPPLEKMTSDQGADLFEVLKRRRTHRLFSKDHRMTFDDFCRYIQFSVGQSHINAYGWSFRTYPSGGSRYPVELSIIPQRVEGLKDLQVYRLDASNNRLYDMNRSIDIETLKASTGASKHEYQEYLDCNLYLFLTSSFQKSTCKYGLLGYRLTWLEAGHMGQNLSLVAEGMGLASVPLGGYYEEQVNRFLGADALGETTLYYYLVGEKR